MAFGENVGSIEYISRINTGQLKLDAAKADAIARGTGDNLGKSIEMGERRGSRAFAALAKSAKLATAAIGLAIGVGIVKNIDNAVKRVDTLNAFPRVLKAMGISATEAQSATDKLDKSLRGLPTSLQEGAQGVQQFVAAGLNAGKATDTYVAMNNALLAAGSNSQDTQIVMQSLTRALSGGTTAASTIQAALSRMPTALKALQKETGKSAGELFKLYAANPQKLTDALIKLNEKGGGGLASLQNQAREATKGIGTAWQNMNTAITRGLGNLLNAIGTSNISGFITGIGKASENAINSLIKLGPIFADIGTKVGDYLGPKLNALWTTISTQIIPILSELWHNVLAPLIPVIGTVLVVALGAATDAFNSILNAISWVITALKNGNPFIWLVIAALGSLATALAITRLINGVGAAFNLLSTVTIPRAIAKVAAMRAAVMAPMVMPAIGVTAALASIGAVFLAVQSVIGAIRDMNNAAAATSRASKDSTDFIALTIANMKSGKISKEQGKRILNNYAKQANSPAFRASGGPVRAGQPYIVGEKRPELFVPHTSGNIIPEVPSGNGVGSNVTISIDMNGIMARSRSDLREVARDLVRSINEELGAKGQALIGGGMI